MSLSGTWLKFAAVVFLPAAAVLATPASGAEPPVPAYAPGLGDFMTAYVQPHHIKLALAGDAGNWKLAAYEASELSETFEDVSTYAATWKGVPVARWIKLLMRPTLRAVDTAIAAKDPAAFKAAYASLTGACNACHVKARHEFLQIEIPGANPYPDQNFAAP
jgi:hypothetical protein